MRIKRKSSKHKISTSSSIPLITVIVIGTLIIFTSFYEKNWSYSWNGIRKNIKDSILKVEFRGITSGTGGEGKSTMNEVKRRFWVMKNASESELLKLTKYPNGNVKAVAYEGLLRNKLFSDKTSLTLEAIKDTIYEVDYQSGCLGMYMSIGEYLIQNVLNIDDRMPPLTPNMMSDFGISKLDKEKILIEFKKSLKEY